jgi:hypothetical protein
MNFNELSLHEKKIFRNNNICPICAQSCVDTEFIPVSFRNGRNVCHFYIHKSCLIEKRKEKNRWQREKLQS